MAVKTAVVITLILAIFMAEAPATQAQLFNFVQVVVNNLRNTVTGLPIANTTSPILSGALVQVKIGTAPVGLGITNSAGSVTITQILPLIIPLNPPLILTNLTTLVNTLLNNGTITVLTPVATVNATLPTGLLVSPLQLVGNITTLLFKTVILGPRGFNVTVRRA